MQYIWAVPRIPSRSPQKNGVQRSPGIALNNECSGSYPYREKTGSLHQLECGRIKDGNTGIEHSECQKGCWKMKKHSRTETVMQSLRDTANGMWDSGHHLLFIAHILLG